MILEFATFVAGSISGYIVKYCRDGIMLNAMQAEVERGGEKMDEFDRRQSGAVRPAPGQGEML